jgi:hypothetical protein
VHNPVAAEAPNELALRIVDIAVPAAGVIVGLGDQQ